MKPGNWDESNQESCQGLGSLPRPDELEPRVEAGSFPPAAPLRFESRAARYEHPDLGRTDDRL